MDNDEKLDLPQKSPEEVKKRLHSPKQLFPAKESSPIKECDPVEAAIVYEFIYKIDENLAKLFQEKVKLNLEEKHPNLDELFKAWKQSKIAKSTGKSSKLPAGKIKTSFYKCDAFTTYPYKPKAKTPAREKQINKASAQPKDGRTDPAKTEEQVEKSTGFEMPEEDAKTSGK